MAFGFAALPTKNYVYGVVAQHRGQSTIAGEDVIGDQIHRMHRYRNELVRAERDRREQVAATLLRLRPRIQQLTDAVAAAVEERDQFLTALKAANAKARRRTATPEQRAEKQRLVGQLRALRADLKAAKTEAYDAPDVESALDAIEEACGQRRKELRAASNLYWGNYLAIEQAAQSFRSGAPPQFKPWRGLQGSVSVQVQNGIGVSDAHAGGDTRIRIEWGNDLPTSPRGERQAVTVLLRVGSDESGKPIFARLPVCLHRPLPPDGRIKFAHIHRSRSGLHWNWSLRIAVSRSEAWEKPDAATAGVVGINLGWRVRPHGLRVAYWYGDDGQHGELVLPHAGLRRWELARQYRSSVETEFDAIRALLADKIQECRSIPDWLRDRTRHIRQWKAAAGMASLFLAWEPQRFEGDAEMFTMLRRWFLLYRRDNDCEANGRKKAVRWRADFYRCFVAGLRRQYRTAHIEPRGTWRSTAKRVEPDAEKGANATADRNRFIASPGRLAEIIREGFAAFGEIEGHITQTCCDCGAEDRFDAAVELMRTCESCGVERDQDERAAINLLRGTPIAPKAEDAPVRTPDDEAVEEVA